MHWAHPIENWFHAKSVPSVRHVQCNYSSHLTRSPGNSKHRQCVCFFVTAFFVRAERWNKNPRFSWLVGNSVSHSGTYAYFLWHLQFVLMKSLCLNRSFWGSFGRSDIHNVIYKSLTFNSLPLKKYEDNRFPFHCPCLKTSSHQINLLLNFGGIPTKDPNNI